MKTSCIQQSTIWCNHNQIRTFPASIAVYAIAGRVTSVPAPTLQSITRVNNTVWSWVNKSREVRILSVWYIWSENPVVQNIWRFTVSQINVLVFFGFLTRLGMSSSLVLGYSVKTLCSFPWIHKHSSSTSTSISSTSFKTSNISFIDNIGNQVTSGPK